MSITAIDKVTAQALKAAEIYTNVNDACPYPFAEPAGQLFKQVFNAARQQLRDETRPCSMGCNGCDDCMDIDQPEEQTL